LDPDSLSEKSLAISSFFRQKLEEEVVERRTNQITFVRPDGSVEGKDVAWCESNDFFQIDDNGQVPGAEGWKMQRSINGCIQNVRKRRVDLEKLDQIRSRRSCQSRRKEIDILV
jgi:hypothetical protein